MQGKRSVIGTWVGPFADLAENFKKLDIFSGFRLFDDAMKGNWDAFVADWKIFVKDAPAEVLAITTAIGGIGLAFGVLGGTCAWSPQSIPRDNRGIRCC